MLYVMRIRPESRLCNRTPGSMVTVDITDPHEECFIAAVRQRRAMGPAVNMTRAGLSAIIFAAAPFTCTGLHAQVYNPGLLLEAQCRAAPSGDCLCASSVEDVLPAEQMIYIVRFYSDLGETWITQSETWFDKA